MSLTPLSRRALLLRSAACALLASVGSLVGPRLAFAAWNKPAFDSKTLADTYKVLGAANVRRAPTSSSWRPTSPKTARSCRCRP